MNISKFENKKIAVIGEGVEGKSAAKFLEKHGAKVEIRDLKQDKNYLDGLDKFDLIVRSPGVRLVDLKKHVSEKKITSQVKLFFDLSPTKNIIGVTGTKGKGTTSSLIFEMLKIEGKDVYIGGNIGVPPLDFIEKLDKNSWVVLELSSFQLQDLDKSPHIGVFLMITREHLDYHKDIAEYINAKRNLLNFQKDTDFAVINRDFPASNESDVNGDGEVYFVSREREVDKGCFALGGQVVMRDKNKEIPLIDTKELILKGEHNQENVCASVIAAHLARVSDEAIRQVLRTFKGLEHRLELVGTINGVEYYNDSFSTTPETAIAAILSFQNPEILILGGSSKKSDFEELGKVLNERNNIKAIIGIGEEWPMIKKNISNLSSAVMMIEGAGNMHTITQAASKIALDGDVVLLSPACASFGMFQNYKDRGEQFKKEVNKLKEKTSQ